MDDREKQIVSIHLESPSVLDRLIRKATDKVYVVEYKYPKHTEYGGIAQKRHQRRYADFLQAVRRFDWLIATQPISKAYLLCFPVDLNDYRKRALNNSLAHDGQCVRCGSCDIKVK